MNTLFQNDSFSIQHAVMKPNRFVVYLSTLLLAVGCLLSSGCEQGRYKPAKWRPPLEDAQATVAAQASLPSRSGSLPMRTGSLPMRSGSLPARVKSNGSMPVRGATDRDSKRYNVYTPQDGTKMVWDTSRKEPFYSPNTNKSRGIPAIGLRSSGGTLPSRSSIGSSTLPSRLPDHLLPIRRPATGSTLPSRR